MNLSQLQEFYRTEEIRKHNRYLRDFVVPSLEEAQELDESSKLRKFGAAMRMVSLLLGPPQALGHEHDISTAPRGAQVVSGGEERDSIKEKPPITSKPPPQKKVSWRRK